MRISTLIESATQHYTNPKTRHIPLYVQGPPGVGKTDAGFHVATAMDIPRERVTLMRPSIMEPTDAAGVPWPDVAAGVTRMLPPFRLKVMEKGRWFFIIDELPQAMIMLQNALGGLVLDRFIGEVMLSDEVYIYMTGNRVEDKAGANKMVTQLGNRIMLLNMDVSMKDWVTWARENGIDPMLITFIIWRDSKSEPVLFDFDPNRISNATPRSWAKVSLIDTTLPLDVYTEMTSGLVGQGRALEYIAFRKHVDSLPDYQVIMADPDNAPIPQQIEVKYAASGWLADKADAKTFPNLLRYIQRMPLDYQVLFVKIASKRDAGIMATRAFVEWVGRNSAAFTTAP